MSGIFAAVGASFLLVMGLMLALWVLFLVTQNSRLLQVGVAVSFVIAAVVTWMATDGYWLRRYLIIGMYLFWSFRLSLLFLKRLAEGRDPRFAKVVTSFDPFTAIHSLMLFLAAGLIVMILAAPLFYGAASTEEGIGSYEVVALLLWIVGFLGESKADWQLHRFRSQEGNESKVLREGFWGWSRHPNYFFEMLIWVSYGLFCLSLPAGWIACVAPALAIYLLFQVTGIPYTEHYCVESKGEAYRQYQNEVSVLVPWFGK